jgi:transketolase N-terminal domain/subunit
MLQHEMDTYRARFDAFGFAVFKVDGHNILELIEIFEKCRNTKGRP